MYLNIATTFGNIKKAERKKHILSNSFFILPIRQPVSRRTTMALLQWFILEI